MTTPSQASLSLPATFAASFWPSYPSYPSYRAALVHLFSLLQRGLDENVALVSFVQQVVESQWSLVDSFQAGLSGASASTSAIANRIQAMKPLFKGSRTEGSPQQHASLTISSRGPSSLLAALNAAAVEPLITNHVRTANALTRSILEPFGQWSQMHAQRVAKSWQTLEEWLDTLETGQDELDRLRANYETKCRQADETEDDARFSGVDIAEMSSDLTPAAAHDTQDRRTESESEEKSSGVEGLADSSAGVAQEADPDEDTSAGRLDPIKLERRQTLRKQFGFSPRIPSGGSELESKKTPSLGGQPSCASSPGINSSGTFSSALSSALSAPAIQGIRERIASATGTGGVAERWKRLRREADRLEAEYVRKAQSLDTLRCQLEDTISEELQQLQKFETDRLASVKTLLTAYSAAMGGLHPSLVDRTQALVKSHGNPGTLISSLIASARTGHYRPLVEIFHPYYHDASAAASSSSAISYGSGWAGFGMNLNAKWRNDLLTSSAGTNEDFSSVNEKPLHATPLAFSQLLSSLERAYQDATLWKASGDSQGADAEDTAAVAAEKRKTWVYEVPLASAHKCREAIIRHVTSSYPGAEHGAGLPAVLDRFDPPTRAATLKVWLAELQECLVGEENWHLVSSLYKAANSVEAQWRQQREERSKDKSAENTTQSNQSVPDSAELDEDIKGTIRQGVLDDLIVVLGKLSSVHLIVLDSLISHLRALVASTSSALETDDIYINKIALSLGPAILRPGHVTPSTLSSKIPTLLLIDLVKNYVELLPPALARKNQREEEVAVIKRRTPRRQRTKALDQRVRRSQLHDAKLVTFRHAQTHSSEPDSLSRAASQLPNLDISGTILPNDADHGDDPTTSTPIAERLFGAEKSAGDTMLDAPALHRETDGDSSAYNTPKEEVASPVSLDTARRASATTTSPPPHTGSGPSSPTKTTTPSTSASAADVPLSNVARLSRQFNSSSSLSSKRLSRLGGSSSGGATSSGSSSSGIRGPRPVNTTGGKRTETDSGA